MIGRILRMMVCLAVALNVMFAVPSLAFAHAQMSSHSEHAQPTSHDGHAAKHDHGTVHEHEHGGAASAQAAANDCCKALAAQSDQTAHCHCDMGLCSPLLSDAVSHAQPGWASSKTAVLMPRDDAGHLSDNHPPLRPPRA